MAQLNRESSSDEIFSPNDVEIIEEAYSVLRRDLEEQGPKDPRLLDTIAELALLQAEVLEASGVYREIDLDDLSKDLARTGLGQELDEEDLNMLIFDAFGNMNNKRQRKIHRKVFSRIDEFTEPVDRFRSYAMKISEK